MNSILLTENEIREYEGIHGFNRVNYGTIAKAAAIHAVQYLEEPCTEHLYCVTDMRVENIGKLSPMDKHSRRQWLHRYLCPDCMANIKKELGI